MQLLAEERESIRKAFEELKRISTDESRRAEYEAREKALRDHISYIRDYTEQGIEQGVAAMIESLQEFGISREAIRGCLLNKFALSEQRADECLERFWK